MNRLPAFLLLLCLISAPAASAENFSAADVYRESAPSVVLIFGYNGSGGGSAGTGSIISDDGLILTNNHVIYDAKSRTHYPKVTVYGKPSRITGNTKTDLVNGMKAKVIARDETLDLALIKVERLPETSTVMSFGDSERAEIGESVAAIGHPGGGGLWTLTTGTISSTRNEGKRQVFQTDAAINPGNSGGPLLDAHARLIGVNTYVKRKNAKGMTLEGLNYSLRSSLAKRWLAGLGVEVITGSVPAAFASDESTRERAPRAEAPKTKSRSRKKSQHESARPYKTRNGKQAYGVPNASFDLNGTLKQVIGRAKRNANSAFDELDAMGDIDDMDDMGGMNDDFDMDDF